MRLRHLITLTLDVGDAPPEEFRIFRKGLNESRKGPVLFDDVAARQVMAAYKQHGADLMIDLDHLSLDVDAPNYDGDARGWCRLELRDGELWAVSVRWTSDGATRLTEKRQRYISPAFRIDAATKRPLFIHNVAITATPATDQLEPLVAASLALDRGIMDLKKLIALLGLPEDATEEQVMAALEALKKAQGETLADDGKEPPTPPEKKPEDDKSMSAVTERLANELVALRAEIGAGRVKEIIRENREKFTPALEAWALTLAPAALEKFVAAMPVIKDAKRHKEPGPERGPARTEEVALSAEENKLCRLSGTDPAKLLAHKIELRKRELEAQEV